MPILPANRGTSRGRPSSVDLGLLRCVRDRRVPSVLAPGQPVIAPRPLPVARRRWASQHSTVTTGASHDLREGRARLHRRVRDPATSPSAFTRCVLAGRGQVETCGAFWTTAAVGTCTPISWCMRSMVASPSRSSVVSGAACSRVFQSRRPSRLGHDRASARVGHGFSASSLGTFPHGRTHRGLVSHRDGRDLFRRQGWPAVDSSRGKE